MNDLIEAFKTRFSSPLLGYFSFALLAFNWQAFFYLVVQSGDVLGRIQFFEQVTTVYSLIIWPLSFALAFAVFHPWAIFLLARITAKPLEMKDMVQAISEHKLLVQRKQLEDARSTLLANAEMELIERAKRDQELDELYNDEVRGKLKAELEQLRAERDSPRENSESPSPIAQHRALMSIADAYRKRAGEPESSTSDKERFKGYAREMEEQAHHLLKSHEVKNMAKV